MKQNPIKLLLLLFLAWTGSANIGNAQDKKPSSYVPEPIRLLDALVGKWDGKVNWETGPIVSKKEYGVSYEFSKGLKGAILNMSSISKENGETQPVETVGIIGYDSSSKMIHIYMINDAGETIDLKGKWTNDNTLNFTFENTGASKKISLNLWISMISHDSVELKMFKTIGDDMLITTDAMLTRKSR